VTETTVFLSAASAASERVDHPLDPLTPAEIRAAAAIARRELRLPDTARFAAIRLLEPPKALVRSYRRGTPFERRAWIAVMDTAAGSLHDGVIHLDRAAVERWTGRPGLQGPLLLDEYERVAELIRNDPRWQAALRRRGVTDPDQVRIDAWMIGNFGLPEEQGRRLCASLAYLVERPGDLPYARPIEGLVAYVDLTAMTLTRVLESDPVPIPADPGRYDAESVGPMREGLRPIEISQPNGPSFTVNGHEIRWQNWSFRWSFNPREGLVLHTIDWNDHGTTRPIIYRASLSEMVVPYGDTSPTHWNKNVFDMGEVGMGFSANPLTLGCDCLGEIFYFDGTVNDSSGNAVTIPNAICIHEEDYGISWKHTDFRTGEVEVRRARRLVISMICTVGNYEYGFFWYFYNDASMEVEVKLSGVLTTGAVPDGEESRWGKLVAPNIYGHNHQHFFNFRLDMSVDGSGNSVYEVDSIPEPDPELNPHHNAWITQDTLVASEAEGARDWDWKTGRYWKIANPSKRNELGSPVAYKLTPREVVPVMVQEGSYIYDRARFVQHNLWVTRYDPDKKFAAGDYMYQSADTQGLPQFIADDAPLEDTDVVLWYTVGAHHVVRPEDWPVMPCAYTGFHLKPIGFFDGNPALDMPRSTPACHAEGDADGSCHDMAPGETVGQSAREQVAE
jgi:primary-amine oxidase